MTIGGMGNASLKMQIGIETMKKAMDVEARQILSLLQSASAGTQPALPDRVASTPSATSIHPSVSTDRGWHIDLKA